MQGAEACEGVDNARDEKNRILLNQNRNDVCEFVSACVCAHMRVPCSRAQPVLGPTARHWRACRRPAERVEDGILAEFANNLRIVKLKRMNDNENDKVVKGGGQGREKEKQIRKGSTERNQEIAGQGMRMTGTSRKESRYSSMRR